MDESTLMSIHARLARINRIIIIVSGKGGVGKSTFSAALAHQLSTDHNVGVIDIDLCGPDIAEIFGVPESEIRSITQTELDGREQALWMPCKSVISKKSGTIHFISLGLMLASKADAVVWRGARKDAMINEFFKKVAWDALDEKVDYLIIDTPPGTSDEHLSLFQLLTQYERWRLLQPSALPLNIGCVIVTTPQIVCVDDAAKIITFCKSSGSDAEAGIKIIGVVENMRGSIVCPHCEASWDFFSTKDTMDTSNAVRLAKSHSLSYLGYIPFDRSLAASKGARTKPETVENVEKFITEIVSQITSYYADFEDRALGEE